MDKEPERYTLKPKNGNGKPVLQATEQKPKPRPQKPQTQNRPRPKRKENLEDAIIRQVGEKHAESKPEAQEKEDQRKKRRLFF